MVVRRFWTFVVGPFPVSYKIYWRASETQCLILFCIVFRWISFHDKCPMFTDFKHHFIKKEAIIEMDVNRDTSKCGFGHWYLVRYFFALMTARRRRVIDWQTLRRVIWGIFCHFLPVLSQVFAGSDIETGFCAHVSPARFTNAQTDLSLEDSGPIKDVDTVRLKESLCQLCSTVCARIVLLELPCLCCCIIGALPVKRISSTY